MREEDVGGALGHVGASGRVVPMSAWARAEASLGLSLRKMVVVEGVEGGDLPVLLDGAADREAI